MEVSVRIHGAVSSGNGTCGKIVAIGIVEQENGIVHIHSALSLRTVTIVSGSFGGSAGRHGDIYGHVLIGIRTSLIGGDVLFGASHCNAQEGD